MLYPNKYADGYYLTQYTKEDIATKYMVMALATNSYGAAIAPLDTYADITNE